MDNFAVFQIRGENRFMVAAFMTDFDAIRFAADQNMGDLYYYKVVKIPHSEAWNKLESEGN